MTPALQRRVAAIRLVVLAATGWLALAGLAAAQTQPAFPALTGRVVDNADLLDAAQEAALNAKLAAVEQRTGITQDRVREIAMAVLHPA